MTTWQVITGDCLEVMPTLTAKVDAVITDPPYGTGAWKREQTGAGSDPRAVLQKEPWDVWNVAWLDAAASIAPTIVSFVPTIRLADFYQWIGDRSHRLFMWTKPDPRPRFSGQPSFSFESFFVVGKVRPVGGDDWINKSSPRQYRDWDGTGHPHQKPVVVMRRAIELATNPGALILDPFCGSGTTGVACMQTGRNFIGIEIDPGYADIARERIAKAEAQARQLPLIEAG